MELPKLFVFIVFLFAILEGQNIGGVHASSRLQERSQKVTKDTFQAKKLFVFGDSYADTGNSEFTAGSWNQPYGITYPGHPAGRYSDGLLLTDYLAKFYGLQTPNASRFINTSDHEQLRYGVNFAYGGTGVFDTGIGNPNLTAQIDILKNYLKDSAVDKTDLETSLSLLSVNGNDYVAYLRHNGTIEGLLDFIKSVVNQITEDMKSLHDLGARKIAVTAMPPSGCIPYFAPSPTHCNHILNIGVDIHNYLLTKNVSELNRESGDSSYFILDLYSAFTTVFNSGVFSTPYQACCVGVSSNYTCGSVDDQGQPMYTVCNDTKSAFYWDGGHPTQAGWNATYELALKDALEQIN